MDIESVADRLKVDHARVSAWESGEQQLSMSQLERLSDLYKRPLAVFYLPSPPKDFAVVRDFRRLPGAPDEPSQELTVELRKAGARREIALDLIAELGEESTKFRLRAQPTEVASVVAQRVRKALRVTPERQQEWESEYVALREWRAVVEAQGVLVFQMKSVRVDETRGFSAFYEKLPVIALNGKDAATARCFTLMHELGHLLLRSGAACDMSGRDRTEVWCNAFAGELLVPADVLRAEVASFAHHEEWPGPVLRSLSRRFWVSPEVVLRRLLTIRRTTQEFYNEWLSSQQDIAPSGGRADPPRQVISHAGVTFVNLVLSAYRARKITASTLSNYLGVKLKHLPAIEALMFHRGPA